jgi:hypothetical protein
MQNIKGINWNPGGFGDTAKPLFVKEAIREHKLDFIALLETGRSNFSIPFLSKKILDSFFEPISCRI